MGSGSGYSYRYELWMDDEIMGRYVPPERIGSKVFFFEFRTEFVVEDGKGYRFDNGSESFHSSCCCSDDGIGLFTDTNVRLCDEYRMTGDEAQSLCLSAMDFAQKMETEHPHLVVIPVVVGIEVRTVRQAGEEFVDTDIRSITPERLLPIHLTQGVKTSLTRYLLEMPKTRVESWKQGLDMMRVCLLCLSFPGVGDRVTFLRCKHPFHTECAVKWLLYSNECPYCNAEEHNLLEESESTRDGQRVVVLSRKSRLIEVQKRGEGELGHMFPPQNEGEGKVKEMQGSYISHIGKVETKLAKTKAAKKDLKIQSDSLKNQLADARDEVDSLKTEQELAKEESDELVERLEKQLADVRDEVDSLKAKLAREESDELERVANLVSSASSNEEVRRDTRVLSEAIRKGLMIFLAIVVVFCCHFAIIGALPSLLG